MFMFAWHLVAYDPWSYGMRFKRLLPRFLIIDYQSYLLLMFHVSVVMPPWADLIIERPGHRYF